MLFSTWILFSNYLLLIIFLLIFFYSLSLHFQNTRTHRYTHTCIIFNCVSNIYRHKHDIFCRCFGTIVLGSFFAVLLLLLLLLCVIPFLFGRSSGLRMFSWVSFSLFNTILNVVLVFFFPLSLFFCSSQLRLSFLLYVSGILSVLMLFHMFICSHVCMGTIIFRFFSLSLFNSFVGLRFSVCVCVFGFLSTSIYVCECIPNRAFLILGSLRCWFCFRLVKRPNKKRKKRHHTHYPNRQYSQCYKGWEKRKRRENKI